MSLTSKVVGAVAVIGIGTALYFSLIKPLFDYSRFRQTYVNALFQYADTNHDDFVTAAERDAFGINLLRDKDVTLIVGQMPRYQNGDSVPFSTVTDWIENYKPAEQ